MIETALDGKEKQLRGGREKMEYKITVFQFPWQNVKKSYHKTDNKHLKIVNSSDITLNKYV